MSGARGGGAAAENAATYAAAAEAYATAAHGAADGIAALRAEVEALSQALAAARGNIGTGKGGGGGGGGGDGAPRQTPEEKEAADKKKRAAKEAEAATKSAAKFEADRVKNINAAHTKTQNALYREADRRAKLEQDSAKKTASASKAGGAKVEATDFVKGAKMAAGAAFALAGARGAMDLGRLAMGYRGMAQLSAIEQRSALQLRMMFKGVDSTPVVKAVDRVSQVFNVTSVTGKALEGIFTRAFNYIFGKAGTLGDLFHTAFQGAVLGALLVENAMLRASIQFAPYIDALDSVVGPTDRMRAAAVVGGAAIAALGIAAVTAGAPVIALAAAFESLAAAIKQAKALYDEWDTNSFKQIKNQLKRDLGFESREDAEKRIQAKGAQGAEFAPRSAAEMAKQKAAKEAWLAGQGAEPKSAPEPAAAAGRTDGKAFADGVVRGVTDGTPGVDAAGRALARSLDAGLRTEGKIHSPSQMTRDTSRYFPEGAALGVRDGLPAVEGAGRSMAGAVGAGMSGGAAGGGGGGAPLIGSLSVSVQMGGGGGGVSDDVTRAIRAGVWQALREVAQSLGRPVALAGVT